MFAMLDFGVARMGRRRGREERRKRMTSGERFLFWAWTITSGLLAPVGVVLLVFGGGSLRAVALPCLLIGLVGMAVPISPVLRAKIRRREARKDA